MNRSRFIKALSLICMFGIVLFSANLSSATEKMVVGVFKPPLEKTWHHQIFGAETAYSYTSFGTTASIKAQGNLSASGLFTDLSPLSLNKERIEWQWRVDEIQQSADLRIKDKEDFAASLFLVFADSKSRRFFPSFYTLAYAWTSMDVPVGTVIESPRNSKRFRTIVLGNKQTPLARWVNEERNFIDDYKKAFGQLPDKPLRTIGIFTDNDNTMEPVTSYYASIAIW